MSLEELVPPTDEPIDVEEAKDYCNITEPDSDNLIESFIVLARQQVEIATGRKLLTTTLKQTFEKFPYTGFSLQGGKVQKINSFTYVDRDGNVQTVDSNLYDLQLNKTPAIVLRKSAYSWPQTMDNGNAVQISYDVGWANKSEIPKNLIIAMKSLVLFYHENRELATTLKTPSYVDVLLFPYTVM